MDIRGTFGRCHSAREFMRCCSSVSPISIASVICRKSGSLLNVRSIFILNLLSSPPCLFVQCFHIKLPSSCLLYAFMCSLPLVYPFLLVSPWYRSSLQLSSSHSTWYFISSFLQFFFSPLLHTKHSSSLHVLLLKGLDTCTNLFSCVPDFSTILILKWVLLIMSSYFFFNLDSGVAGTKMTLSKPPLVYHSVFFLV